MTGQSPLPEVRWGRDRLEPQGSKRGTDEDLGRGPEHGPAVPRLGRGHVVSGLSGSGENEARPDGRRPSWGAALPGAWAP